jgi:hypothetical protein
MLKQVQHDRVVWFSSFCHPEPGPELDSGSNDFGISVLGLEFGFKAPPCGQGSLLGLDLKLLEPFPCFRKGLIQLQDDVERIDGL